MNNWTKIWMYWENPVIKVWNFTISEMTIEKDWTVWNKIWIADWEEDASEFSKEKFEKVLKEFYNKNF